jgi:hypothetical protein
VVSEATKADDIFTRFSSDILNAMFAIINRSGRNGAPSHAEKINKTFNKNRSTQINEVFIFQVLFSFYFSVCLHSWMN